VTLAAVASPLRAPIGVIDPLGVARREAALIEVLRARPGATLPEIAEVAEGSRGAVIDRLKRLAARGAVVKIAGHWRLAGERTSLIWSSSPSPSRNALSQSLAHNRDGSSRSHATSAERRPSSRA
jgi:hypothetical protein